MSLRVTLIAGGVGGAKMAEGFAALPDVTLTVIGNIADDDEFHGLWVSPDIDTLTYSLAGMIDREQGWGVADEGLRALGVLETLGSETWMTLGDKDFGLHIYRSERRRRGDRPTHIARDVAGRFGVSANIVLPTDDVVRTKVRTSRGWMSFQEYFVREKCAPDVLDLRYEGIDIARPAAEALAAVAGADLIVLAPSNPLVSIAPILDVPGIRQTVATAPAPVIAVSPLIAGKVVKGPADRMMASMGLRPDALGVSSFFEDVLDTIAIAHEDENLAQDIVDFGVYPLITDIMLPNQSAKVRLARRLVEHFRSGKLGVAA